MSQTVFCRAWCMLSRDVAMAEAFIKAVQYSGLDDEKSCSKVISLTTRNSGVSSALFCFSLIRFCASNSGCFILP